MKIKLRPHVETSSGLPGQRSLRVRTSIRSGAGGGDDDGIGTTPTHK